VLPRATRSENPRQFPKASPCCVSRLHLPPYDLSSSHAQLPAHKSQISYQKIIDSHGTVLISYFSRTTNENAMKRILPGLLVLTLLSLSGCQLIGDIFKAGVWSGILLVVVVLGLIIFVIAKLLGGGK